MSDRAKDAAYQLGLAVEELEHAEAVYKAAVERKLEAARAYSAVIADEERLRAYAGAIPKRYTKVCGAPLGPDQWCRLEPDHDGQHSTYPKSASAPSIPTTVTDTEPCPTCGCRLHHLAGHSAAPAIPHEDGPTPRQPTHVRAREGCTCAMGSECQCYGLR